MDKNFTLIELLRVLTLAILGTIVFAVLYLRFGMKRSVRKLIEFDRRESRR